MTTSQGLVFSALMGRYLLGAIFLAAGVGKLIDRRRFARTVAAYELLPRHVVPVIARWLPPAELLAGAAICLNVQLRFVATIVGLALMTFAVASGYALHHGRQVECGCFGAAAGTRLSWTHVAGNLLLAFDAFFQGHPPSAGNFANAVPHSLTIPAVILATIGLCLLLLAPDALRAARWLRSQSGGGAQA
jgi:uncharacterized membrane protein YphA (DoxX/SURF4 family)